MKSKIIIFVIGLSTILLVLVLVLQVKFKAYHGDTYQRRFVINAGFLSGRNEGTDAISHYAHALQILKSKKADKIDWTTFTEDPGIAEGLEIDFGEICDLLVGGAKMQELEASIDNWNMVIHVPSYGAFKFSEFILLPKVLSQIAKANLVQNKELDKALLIGNASIAMGVQFSAYDSKLVHLVGLSCKEKGLDVLETYAEVSGDRDLLKQINDMRKEFKHELEKVKKQKDLWLIFWDFF